MRNSFGPTAPYLYTFVLKILSSPIHSEIKKSLKLINTQGKPTRYLPDSDWLTQLYPAFRERIFIVYPSPDTRLLP